MPRACRADAREVGQQRVDEAYELGKVGIVQPGATAELMAVMGDVLFRRAEMNHAEIEYKQAPQNRSQGGADLSWTGAALRCFFIASQSLRVTEDSTSDCTEQPRGAAGMAAHVAQERAAASDQDYLSLPHPDDEDATIALRQYAGYLEATLGQPVHACRLISKVED